MKAIFSTLLLVSIAISTSAANLTATVSSGAGIGSKKGKINLTISGGIAPYTILWTGPGGYSSTKINPDSLASGTYCVSVTDQYCGVAKLCVTLSEQTSSIDEITLAKAHIYPNPFGRELFIDLNDHRPKGDLSLKLFDPLGKLVAYKKCAAAQHLQWTFENELAAGFYLISVESEDGFKLVRQVCRIGK
jgi:hypothetical protein